MTPEEAIDLVDPISLKIKEAINDGYNVVLTTEQIRSDELLAPALLSYLMNIQIQIERIYHFSLKEVNPDEEWIDVRNQFRADHPTVWNFDEEEITH